MFSTASKRAFTDLIERVTGGHPGIQIISHGYGYAIPDGRAVVRFAGLSYIGPWLRPVLTKKGIIEAQEGRDVMRYVIDRFTEMLQELDDENDNFHHIDLRGDILDVDWANELHLYIHAYLRVAQRFDEKIREFMGA